MKQLILIFYIILSNALAAQHPFHDYREALEVRYTAAQPVISYTLRVDKADTSSFSVEMRIRNIPDTFRVAMVTHPEYDDRFWRYVNNFSARGKKGNGIIKREDNALWQIIAPGGEAVLNYTIEFPKPREITRPAWSLFLSPSGGLLGGPQSFMYIIGATLAPSHVTFDLPDEWKIATGLSPTDFPNTFFAPTAFSLMDAPVLAGQFRKWQFKTDDVPHTVVYLPVPGSKAFDTTTLVNYIMKLVQQSVNLFGRLPYREYFFLVQDGAWGALEHSNSVTIGMTSEQLSNDITNYLDETAHEFIHTWNLMRIHPVEYQDVNYIKQPLSKGLWWSEGLTLFYADLLLRRAGLPVYDSTRIKHLEGLISRYYNNPAYLNRSAEQISMAAYGPPGMLGDYGGGTHLQGELLGNILDLIIRDETNGIKSMDDLMRNMMENYSGSKGFTGKNIESLASRITGRNLQQFFDNHIRGHKEIEFDKYLASIGLKMNLSWIEAAGNDGKPTPDFRIFVYQDIDSLFKITITNPGSIWGKAGLHSRDIVKSVNGSVLKTPRDFRIILSNLKMGDTMVIEVERSSKITRVPVIISGYKRAMVNLEPLPGVTSRQKELQKKWMEGR